MEIRTKGFILNSAKLNGLVRVRVEICKFGTNELCGIKSRMALAVSKL